MNRLFSFLLTVLAIVISFRTIQFFNNYFVPVHSSKTNVITQISFWTIIVTAVFLVFTLVFFQRWIYINRRKLLFSLAILFLGIVSIELFFRKTDNRPLRFAPHPYINYMGTPYYKSADGLNIHNSLGMRGPEITVPKPQGRIRIAIIGGSTVYEEFVKDWKKDFARQLESDLKHVYPNKDIEVVNAGLPGWDSWNDLVNLEFRLIDLNLDMIIVYEGVNDVHARMVKPAAYKSDDSGNIMQWGRNPCTALLCFSIVQRMIQYDPPKFDISAATRPIPHPESTKYNDVLGMTRMEALEKNPPIYYERNLRSIIALAKEFGINVLLSTWAWSDQLNDYTATAHYQKGFQEINEVITKVAELKQVPVYDFASEMPKDKKYWADGPHNNDEGVALKAKLFSIFISRNNILDFQ